MAKEDRSRAKKKKMKKKSATPRSPQAGAALISPAKRPEAKNGAAQPGVSAPEHDTATSRPASSREAALATATGPPGRIPIIGIGASAGGLDALERFLKAMPADTGIGLVLVVHLDPTHISILPDLLQKHTTMPVRSIQDGMSIERDHVYVIPPNRGLTVTHGRLRLTDLAHRRGANLPIDAFFRSLAQDQKRDAVCIILSGTGTDGTLGVKAVKDELGMVMVQDEASAKYDGMPRSAIATGLVDHVLPPEKMAAQLVEYARHAAQKAVSGIASAEGAAPEALQQIHLILRARTNHDFSLYKKNTICRRIERRMNVHQIDDIADYARYLQENGREAGILFKELLIGVTSFFRDPEAFDVLQTKGLPKLLAGRPDDLALRIWVPACASGEEAYSVAIALHECMERTGRHFHVQIFGTDIDETAIDVARAGVYPASILADVGPERIMRYFVKDDDGRYRVAKLIREMLVFAPQNVIKDPPFTKLDVLCCRNLLIYLGAELQRDLLHLFHYSLKRDGLLFLGSSESIGQATDLFSVTSKKWKIFRRRRSSATTRALLPPRDHTRSAREAPALNVPEAVQRAEDLSALQLVETILKQSDIPPSAIINDDGDTVFIHGRTGKFLELAEGRVNMNIVDMARPALRQPLAAAIRQVASHKKVTVRRGIQLDLDGSSLLVDVAVKPILELSSMRGLMMVVFEETATPVDGESPRPTGTPARRRKSADALEDELQFTKENLHTTIEELETSNEELQSTNEELQSTNEELETSKEELQSLNEESTTVNSELQARIEELSSTNDDMKNLLDSTEIATIFLDADLRIRRYTPRATEIIPLTAADSGRPIEHLASSLEGIDLARYGERVLSDLAVRADEVRSRDGRSYMMRVRPYRTVANVIDGVVITFEDITARKLAEEGRELSLAAMELERDKLRALIDSVADEVWFCDADGELVLANTAALDGLGLERIEQVAQPVSQCLSELEITDPEGRAREGDAAPLLRSLRGEVLKEVEERIRDRRSGAWLNRLVSSAPLRDGLGEITGAVAVVHDITESRRAERDLQESELRYRMLFDLASDSIVLVSADTGAIVEFNQQAYELLGYTREQFSKLSISDIEATEGEDDVARHLARIVCQGGDEFTTTHRTRSGEVRPVRVRAKSIALGEQAFLLSTWYDMARADDHR